MPGLLILSGGSPLRLRRPLEREPQNFSFGESPSLRGLGCRPRSLSLCGASFCSHLTPSRHRPLVLATRAAVDKGGPLLPSGGHCHQGASLWTAQLGTLSPQHRWMAHPGCWMPPCPPLVWRFSHLTGSGGGSLDRRRPVFSYWLLLKMYPVTLVTASPAPLHEPGRAFPVSPSHSVHTWFISNIQTRAFLPGAPRVSKVKQVARQAV